MRQNQGQESGEQKKSVFDRLGRQLDAGRQHSRRSPAQFGDHPMHPPPGAMHEPPEFGGSGGASRYMRGDGHPEMDWRGYQNDRRHMGQFGGRGDQGRHPSQVGPPPMPHPSLHYEMEGGMPGRQPPPPYYQHGPPPPHYQLGPPGGGGGGGGGPPGPTMPPMMGGPDAMNMGMHHHQRRPSPKYDRHGNPIRGNMRVDHGPSGGPPPRNFMGPPMGSGPMMPPGPYEGPMMNMRPDMYPPQNRWPENLEMGPQMHGARMMSAERFMEPHNRFQQQQKPPMMMNPEMVGAPQQPSFEAPRYSKWRERRNMITNLDKQTAQSSSKTDSLKSTLQLQEGGKGNMSKKSKSAKLNEQPGKQASDPPASSEPPSKEKPSKSVSSKNEPSDKREPQDISDGEIVDDEDSSEDSEEPKDSLLENTDLLSTTPHSNRLKSSYTRKPSDGGVAFYEPGKRRRLHDRDEYSMDYETISDEELDDFMSDKKSIDEAAGRGMGKKNSSEIELLNALGLDWANLIELSKQSRKDVPQSDSALRRFSLANYLPTLGITEDLAGREIYEMILNMTH